LPGGDGLFACGEGFQVAADYHCDYVYTFKPGRLPTLWQDFQGLLKLCPEQRLEVTTQEARQSYRWANDLRYEDSDGREWAVNAIACREVGKDGEEGQWAWLTPLEASRETVVEIATKGGRQR
jgi:hypothetical protein